MCTLRTTSLRTFHVVSKQRKIEARFHIQTLELISRKRGEMRQKEVK
jgi:hypothetical protein